MIVFVFLITGIKKTNCMKKKPLLESILRKKNVTVFSCEAQYLQITFALKLQEYENII